MTAPAPLFFELLLPALRETLWERFLPRDLDVIWKDLPLFASFVNDSLQQRSKEHAVDYCLQNGWPDLVEWLLATHRGKVDKMYVMRYAAESRNPETMQWALDRGYKWDRWAAKEIVLRGDLETLKWASARGLNPEDGHHFHIAAVHGSNDILCWGLEQGFLKPDNGFVRTDHAAGANQLSTLILLRANNFPWTPSTCAAAAAEGHWEMLKYLNANGCDWNIETTRAAAENKHLNILKWAIELGCPADQKARDLVANYSYPLDTAPTVMQAPPATTLQPDGLDQIAGRQLLMMVRDEYDQMRKFVDAQADKLLKAVLVHYAAQAALINERMEEKMRPLKLALDDKVLKDIDTALASRSSVSHADYVTVRTELRQYLTFLRNPSTTLLLDDMRSNPFDVDMDFRHMPKRLEELAKMLDEY